MIRLDVWLTLPSGDNIKAGILIIGNPNPVRGELQGQFRYTTGYLEHPLVFPLDPFHLPLSTETLEADRPREGVHGVFEDSLPDDWGRRLMIRRHKLGRHEQRIPNLLRLLGSQGLGALSYVEEGRPEVKTTGGFQPTSTGAGIASSKIRKGPRNPGRQ